MVEPSGNAKAQRMFPYIAVVHDAADGERSPRDGDRPASNLVIDDLVPLQDADRIGARFFTDHYADNLLFRSQVVDLAGRNDFRMIDGGDGVLRHNLH